MGSCVVSEPPLRPDGFHFISIFVNLPAGIMASLVVIVIPFGLLVGIWVRGILEATRARSVCVYSM